MDGYPLYLDGREARGKEHPRLPKDRRPNGPDTLQAQYPSAPEEEPDRICDWQYKKERHYNDSQAEIGDRKRSEDTDVIYATTQADGIEYILSAASWEEGGYPFYSVCVQLTSGKGPCEIDMEIYRPRKPIC